MVIESERLIIRDYNFEDLPVIHELVKPLEIYQYQQWGPNSEEDTENYIKMCISQQSEKPRMSFELCIVSKEDNKIVGAIGIRVRSGASKKSDLGYWIRHDLWGRGFATEATKAIIKFGFEELGMNRIWATASPENIASLKVLEKAGMQLEGSMRDDMFVRGEFRDSTLMAILKKDYELL